MKRRRFITAASASGVFLGMGHAFPGTAKSQDLPDRNEGSGRFAVVANRTYGMPRWDSQIRVPGTYVIANTYAPEGNDFYYVSLYAQFRRDNGPWQDVPVVPRYRGSYEGGSGGARDWIKVEQKQLTVCLFVPDRVLYLREGPVQLRHELRFFDERDRHVERLNSPIRPFSANVQLAEGERTLHYGYAGIAQLAVDIYDVYQQQPVNVELGG